MLDLAYCSNSRHPPFVTAAEIHQLSPSLWIWQQYDPAVKADLFSSAIRTTAGIYVIDPIPLAEDQLRLLKGCDQIVGIIATNANHHRSALAYADRFLVPIFADPKTFPESKPRRLNALSGDLKIGGDLEVIEIQGAVAGEIALYQESNGGTLVVGDVLINFESYGLAFLPRKYCDNEKRMRRSLHQLLSRPAERIFFAHGMPILSGATARLQQLLEADAQTK